MTTSTDVPNLAFCGVRKVCEIFHKGLAASAVTLFNARLTDEISRLLSPPGKGSRG